MKYGRSDAEWETLVDAGRTFLEERATLRADTTYTEMNTVLARRTGVRPFEFEREDERAAMGYLLGLVIEETFPHTGVMLSALVRYLNANDAGTGFYQLAQQLGLLRRGATAMEKLEFWSSQVGAVLDYYSGRGSEDAPA